MNFMIIASGKCRISPREGGNFRGKCVNLLFYTRMHSSRMRTGRSLTVCRSLLPGGGCLLLGVGVCSGGCVLRGVCSRRCLLPGDVCSQGVSAPRGRVSAPRGVSAPGGVCSRGGLPPGEVGIPACTEADTPLPPWTESQTPVKTLPWPNFVAAGKNIKELGLRGRPWRPLGSGTNCRQ